MGRRFSTDATLQATSNPDIGELSTTVRRGAVISAITLVLVQVVSLVQTLILARLLSPEEIGLFAAGTVLSGFLIGFSEGGLRGALIQRDDQVTDAADTVFWVTAGSGALLAVASLVASPLVGIFFQDDMAGVIAAVSSGTLLMHALTNVPDGLMQRRFNFKRRLIVDPTRVLAYAIVSVTLAATGYGVWALVIANYVGLAVWLVGTWWLAKWRPGVGRPSYRLWREMARYAAPLLAEGMVDRVRSAAETSLVGRTLQADTLGQYRYGQRLSMIPALAIVQIGSYVLFPAFSRVAGDPERLKAAFLRSLQWIWVASIPIAGLTLAVGEPAVVLLLGEEWRAAGLAVMAMSGYGVGIALQASGSEVIKASGRSSLLNWTTVTSLVVGVGLLAALLPLGLLGVGIAMSATELVIGVVLLVLVRRVVPFSAGRMAWLLTPPTIAAGVAMVVVGALERLVVRADTHGALLGILLLVVESLAYLVVYLLVLGLIAPTMRRSLVSAVQSRLAARRRHAVAGDGEDRDEDDRYDMDAATTYFRLPGDVDDTMQFSVVRRRSPAPSGVPVRGLAEGVGPPVGPRPPHPTGRPIGGGPHPQQGGPWQGGPFQGRGVPPGYGVRPPPGRAPAGRPGPGPGALPPAGPPGRVPPRPANGPATVPRPPVAPGAVPPRREPQAPPWRGPRPPDRAPIRPGARPPGPGRPPAGGPTGRNPVNGPANGGPPHSGGPGYGPPHNGHAGDGHPGGGHGPGGYPAPGGRPAGAPPQDGRSAGTRAAGSAPLGPVPSGRPRPAAEPWTPERREPPGGGRPAPRPNGNGSPGSVNGPDPTPGSVEPDRGDDQPADRSPSPRSRG